MFHNHIVQLAILLVLYILIFKFYIVNSYTYMKAKYSCRLMDCYFHFMDIVQIVPALIFSQHITASIGPEFFHYSLFTQITDDFYNLIFIVFIDNEVRRVSDPTLQDRTSSLPLPSPWLNIGLFPLFGYSEH